MSLITFINESTKYLCLIILSITYSFNYLNYIPFIIIFLREVKNIDLSNNINLLLYFIIYEIIKYISMGLTIKLNDLIGEYFYYSLSLCILSLTNLIFSFLSLSYNDIFIYISHRILISLFNNIASSIDLPLSLFYSKKQMIFKKRNFSFIQKLTNFLFFVFFLFFYNYLKKFYIYFFLCSVLNLVSFICSLILLFFHREKVYNNYIPHIPEKDFENSIIKTFQKGKMENNKNNDIMVDMYNNNSVSNNNNISTGANNMEISIKENKNNINVNLIYNESIKNENKSIDQTIKQKNNQNIFRGVIFPFSSKIKNKQNLLHKKAKKIFFGLLTVFTLSKSLNFLSLYMLLFKVNKTKILSIMDENDYKLLFYKISSFLKLTTIEEEYIFLFTCYYFLNIIFYFINISYTSIAFKKKLINYIIYYFSTIIHLLASLLFIYLFSQNFINTKLSINKIRKGIINSFIINYIMNECIMIMSVFFNIYGKKKEFSEKLLKDVKALSIFFSSVFILILEIIIISLKIEINYEIDIYCAIYNSFIIIIILISVFLLNY